MALRSQRSIVLALIACAGVALPVTTGLGSKLTATDAIDQAAELIQQGRSYEARQLLTHLIHTDGSALTDRQSSRAFDLLGQAGRRISSTSPGEMSLQKAEAALRSDRLAEAAEHSRRGYRSGDPKAAAFLRYIERRRSEVAPYAIQLIADAQSAYDQGEYAEAKTLASMISGWGVELPLSDRSQLESLQSRIVGLEATRGAAFDSRLNLSMMQPGVVRRRSNQPQSESGSQPQAQPETQPQAQPQTPPASSQSSPPPLPDLPPPPRQTSSGNNVPPPPNIDDLLRDIERDARVTQPTPQPASPVVSQPTPVAVQPQRSAPAPTPQPASADQSSLLNLPPPPRQTGGQTPPPRYIPDSRPAPQTTTASTPTSTPAPTTTTFVAPATPSVSMPSGTFSNNAIGVARDFEAADLLRSANAAFESRRLSEAATLYERLSSDFSGALAPDELALVNSRLAESRVMIQSAFGAEGDVLGDVIRQRELARQQAEAEFNNQLQQARQALSEGDIDRARELAVTARLTANGSRQFFAETQLLSLNDQIDEFLAEVDVQDEIIAREQEAERSLELEEQAELALRNQILDRQNKIAESLERVRALQMDLKYEEALQVVDQILFLDPISPAGLALRDAIETTLIFDQYHDIQREKLNSYMGQSIENERSQIAPVDIINYPSDWPAISVNRLSSDAGAEPPENRAVIAQLQDNTKRFPVQFADNALIDVLAFFEQVTQLNMQVQWASLEEIGIERDTPISLNFRPVT
ncbi:MAG: hypothetical protein AAGK04_02085, partial [Planctomycetota bacterium]